MLWKIGKVLKHKKGKNKNKNKQTKTHKKKGQNTLKTFKRHVRL